MIFFNNRVINLFERNKKKDNEKNTLICQKIYIGEFIDKTSFYNINDFAKISPVDILKLQNFQ
jgi:hypothetical protein